MINHVSAEINKRFQTVRIFGSMCSARVILPLLLDRAAIMAAQPLGSQLADVLGLLEGCGNVVKDALLYLPSSTAFDLPVGMWFCRGRK